MWTIRIVSCVRDDVHSGLSQCPDRMFNFAQCTLGPDPFGHCVLHHVHIAVVRFTRTRTPLALMKHSRFQTRIKIVISSEKLNSQCAASCFQNGAPSAHDNNRPFSLLMVFPFFFSLCPFSCSCDDYPASSRSLLNLIIAFTGDNGVFFERVR